MLNLCHCSLGQSANGCIGLVNSGTCRFLASLSDFYLFSQSGLPEIALSAFRTKTAFVIPIKLLITFNLSVAIGIRKFKAPLQADVQLFQNLHLRIQGNARYVDHDFTIGVRQCQLARLGVCLLGSTRRDSKSNCAGSQGSEFCHVEEVRNNLII